LPQIYKALDKAAKVGVIKKNTASRKKSRLTIFFNKAIKEINQKKS
jgi:ribosomal protein S20